MILVTTTSERVSYDQEHVAFGGWKLIPGVRAMSRDGLVLDKLGAIPSVNVRISIIRSFVICDGKERSAVSVDAVWLAVDIHRGKLLEQFKSAS